MKISSILGTKGSFVATVGPDTTVTELLAVLAENKIGAVVVVDESGAVAGIVSERDIARALNSRGATALDEPTSTIMTSLVVVCDPEAVTGDLMELMTEKRVRHIPVVQDDELVGIVSIGDVVKAHLAELETERDALQSYISS